MIAKQETRCMELEKASADNDSKKKKALTDVKATEEKLAKQETLVTKKKKNRNIIHTETNKQTKNSFPQNKKKTNHRS